MFSNIAFLATALLPCLSTTLPHGAKQPNLSDPSYKFVPPRLNITTLAGNSRNQSVIECWSVATLEVSSTPGIQGALVTSLGKPSGATYFNIPGQFNGGLHNAPAVQYVWYTSGTGVISLPTSKDTVTVKGGAKGLILAADIASVSALGHITKYPTKERTVGLVLPLANNTVPVHTVVHAGACTKADGLDYLNTETD